MGKSASERKAIARHKGQVQSTKQTRSRTRSAVTVARNELPKETKQTKEESPKEKQRRLVNMSPKSKRKLNFEKSENNNANVVIDQEVASTSKGRSTQRTKFVNEQLIDG